jgi:hypothetical protein
MTGRLRHVKVGSQVAAASRGFLSCGIGAGGFLGTEAGAASSPRTVRRPSYHATGCHMGLIIGLQCSATHHTSHLRCRLMLLLSCKSRDNIPTIAFLFSRERNISISTRCESLRASSSLPKPRPASSLRIAPALISANHRSKRVILQRF